LLVLLCSRIPLPLPSPLFPYTTLFRSVLSIAAAALGAGLAFGALNAIIAIVPPNTIPDEARIAIDTSVLQFTLIVSILTTLLFGDRKSTRLNSSHQIISYAVFCLKKKI